MTDSVWIIEKQLAVNWRPVYGSAVFEQKSDASRAVRIMLKAEPGSAFRVSRYTYEY